jgi:hypothetical protein
MPFDGTDFEQALSIEKIDKVIGLLDHEDRWCKGIMRSPDGRRCLAGAIYEADARSLLTPVILQAIHEIAGRSHWRIESFNDARSTTHAEVMRVLYRARENVLSGAVVAAAEHPRAKARWTLAARPLWRRLFEIRI